jgi:hypothetical protein
LTEGQAIVSSIKEKIEKKFHKDLSRRVNQVLVWIFLYNTALNFSNLLESSMIIFIYHILGYFIISAKLHPAAVVVRRVPNLQRDSGPNLSQTACSGTPTTQWNQCTWETPTASLIVAHATQSRGKEMQVSWYNNWRKKNAHVHGGNRPETMKKKQWKCL